MMIAYTIAAFVFGTIIGSFLNVVILRLPQEEALTGRSHCPHCGHVLQPWELIPVVSFLMLGRKCRECKKPISWRYFTVELVTGFLFAILWLLRMPSDLSSFLLFARDAITLSTLVVVFVVDFEHYLIFDTVLLFSGVGVLGLAVAYDLLSAGGLGWLHSLTFEGVLSGIGAALPLYLLWFFSNGKWMGFGDVKFMLFLGLAVGWPFVVEVWLLSFFLGALFSVFLLIFHKKNMQSKLPFGTFLSIAAVLAIFWGEKIAGWYLSLLGF